MLGAIGRELATLSRADRTAVLAALSEGERARVIAAMRDEPAAAEDVPGRHSTWFAGRMAAAGDATDPSMTADVRAALLEAVGRSTPVERTSGRSLLQAAGQALGKVR